MNYITILLTSLASTLALGSEIENRFITYEDITNNLIKHISCQAEPLFDPSREGTVPEHWRNSGTLIIEDLVYPQLGKGLYGLVSFRIGTKDILFAQPVHFNIIESLKCGGPSPCGGSINFGSFTTGSTDFPGFTLNVGEGYNELGQSYILREKVGGSLLLSANDIFQENSNWVRMRYKMSCKITLAK